MRRLVACDREYAALIDKLRIARRRGDPATIDRDRGRLRVPDTFDPFAAIKIGEPFGPFRETILRANRFVGEHERPLWFQPKGRSNHIALHSRYGHAVYFEVLVDREARDAHHPFDLTVSTRVESGPQVMSLFDLDSSARPSLLEAT